MKHLLSNITHNDVMQYRSMIDYMVCHHPSTKSANCFNIRTREMVSYSHPCVDKALVYDQYIKDWNIVDIQDIADDLVDIESITLRITKYVVRFITRTWLYDKLYISHVDVDERFATDEEYQDELKKMIIRQTEHQLFDMIKKDMVIKITSY